MVHRLRDELDQRGFTTPRAVLGPARIEALRSAVDVAVQAEADDFGPGDPQHGRLLFAPAHGGPFLDVLGDESLMAPFDEALGSCILYTMTTSVLAPGSAGPVHDDHRDLELDRPDGVGLVALVMLDRFAMETGATEFVVGSHRDPNATERELIVGDPGDVCYFDPKTLHRSTTNRSDVVRRALLIMMVKPWMKQRVDVAAFLGAMDHEALPGPVRRRLGLDALAPISVRDFLDRRVRRPWT